MRYLLLNIKFWFLGNIKKYIPFLSDRIRSTTSIITVNYHKKTVKKETIRYMKYNIVENEEYWLNQLDNFEHTPKVILRNRNKLTLSYAGENLNISNIPDDWESQVKIILKELRRINCSHNDIKPTDLLILNGKIMIIDFQWATKNDEKPPSDWPSCIGGKYKSNTGFNDQYSIYKSIHSIIKRI